MLSQLQAVADDTRIRILELTARGLPTASDLNQALGMSQPRVAHHLKILVTAGILNAERDGRFMRYTLPREGFEAKLARLILDHAAGREAPAVSRPAARPAGPVPRRDRSERPALEPTAARPEPPQVAAEVPASPEPGDIEDFLL